MTHRCMLSQTRRQVCCKLSPDNMNRPCWSFPLHKVFLHTQLCFCKYLFEFFLPLVSTLQSSTVAFAQSLVCRGENLVLWFINWNEMIKWELTNQIICALAFFSFLADKSNKSVQFCFASGSINQSRGVLMGSMEWLHIPASIVRQKQQRVGKKSAGHLFLCL